MEVRYGSNPIDVKYYDTERLRNEFLVNDMFKENELKMICSYNDRLIIGTACPKEKLYLTNEKEPNIGFLLDNREIGIINIGGDGIVIEDGQVIQLNYNDGLYIGKGAKEVVFKSLNPEIPAKFYFNSAPAHKSYPTVKIDASKIKPESQGDIAQSNKRRIYKYIYPTMCQSCQLVMGITVLEPNNLWNTMPSHIHSRRAEIYLYYKMLKTILLFILWANLKKQGI